MSNNNSSTRQRITLALVAQKIDQLSAMVEQHVQRDDRQFDAMREALEGLQDRPGLKGRIDRLEQAQASRSWQFRALWTALWGAVLSAVAFGVFGKF
jgi:CRISPR/Cas system-associated endonuclease Cas1